MVIVLRKRMGLISQILQHLQAKMIARQSNWLALGLRVNEFLFLRQRNHHRRADVHRLENIHRRVKLAEAAVDQDHMRIQLVVRPRFPIPSAHDFLDAQVIVVPLPVFNFVAMIPVLKRNAVDKANLAPDHLAPLQVGNVDPFNNLRRLS